MAAKGHHLKNSIVSRTGRGLEHVPSTHYFVPNLKAKSKSRAESHVMEFLSRVFASEGASRFFKTFLLRFLFDGSAKSSDDASATMMVAVAR